MVRPERFELPAFWFVARRSIQLSYGRNAYCGMVRPERFELPTLWFVAKYSIQLSYGRTHLVSPETFLRLSGNQQWCNWRFRLGERALESPAAA